MPPGDGRRLPAALRAGEPPLAQGGGVDGRRRGDFNHIQRFGKERIDRYLRSFGFGSHSALGFPNESAGLLLPPEFLPLAERTHALHDPVSAGAIGASAAGGSVRVRVPPDHLTTDEALADTSCLAVRALITPSSGAITSV